MARRCLECKKELDDSVNSVYCEDCRPYPSSGNIILINCDYNYSIHRNSGGGSEAPRSDYYNDQYSW